MREGWLPVLTAWPLGRLCRKRLSADQGQGIPLSVVVAKASGKTSRARKSRGRTGAVKILEMGRIR